MLIDLARGEIAIVGRKAGFQIVYDGKTITPRTLTPEQKIMFGTALSMIHDAAANARAITRLETYLAENGDLP
jgi:hypothetical protein